MKKIFTIALVSAMFMMSACGQKLKESQVPAPTKEAFKKQYPGTLAKWEKEDGNYEVNFKYGGKDMSAVISNDGTIIETETDIAIADLPQVAQDYVKAHYAGAAIKEASKITKANGEMIYEAMVKGKDVLFDANGKYLKEVKE